MNKSNRLLTGLTVGLSLLIIFLWIVRVNQSNVVQIDNHTLQNTIIQEFDDLYQLNGRWEFFPDRLYDEIKTDERGETVELGHFWTPQANGYASGVGTYRMVLTRLAPRKIYGIFLQDAASAYRIRVNGVVVVEVGSVERQDEGYQSAYFSDMTAFESDANGQAELVIEVANYTNIEGGLWHAPIIGSLQNVHHYFSRIELMEVYLAASLMALGYIFSLMAAYNRERRTLYMAYFVMVITLQLLNSGSHLVYFFLPKLPGIWTLRMEYMSNYLLMLIFGLLLESFELKLKHRSLHKVYLAIIPMDIVFTLLATHYWLDLSFQVFKIGIVFYVVYVLQYLYRAYRQKVDEIGYIFAAILVLALGALYEIFIHEFKYSLQFSALIFILILSIGIVVRFAHLEKRHDELSSAVLTDPLTLIGNRQGFYATLQQLSAPLDKRIYILFMDLNAFKEINDQKGHQVGDQVLMMASERIQSVLRSDDRLFRFGGDEFVLVTLVQPSFDIQTIVDRLRHAFEEPMVLAEDILQLSLSIGVASYDPLTDDLEEVIRKSDELMYEDKRKQKKDRT